MMFLCNFLKTYKLVIHITCGIIMYSRGGNPQQDNLIAIEIKKSMNNKRDKSRLIVLIKDSFDIIRR